MNSATPFVVWTCAAAALLFGIPLAERVRADRQAVPAADPLLEQCSVRDGQTLRCGSEVIRINGIRAPRAGEDRFGMAGDSLHVGLGFGPVAIDRIGRDHDGTTVAQVRAGTFDLSCWQLAVGVAQYDEQRDAARKTEATCL